MTTVARAARLGLITPADYQQRLEAAGYSSDDIAIELDLLTAEIADTQAARATQTAADAGTPAGGLTLTQMAAAVRAGFKGLADYQGLAVSKGLSDDTIATLTRLLGDELAATKTAQDRRTAIGSTLAAKDVHLATLEAQVQAGTLTLEDYAGTLYQAGLDPLDVSLLANLLSDALAGAGVP